MKNLLHLLRKSPNIWILAIKALFLSGYYRWTILHRPFSELSPKIGTIRLETEIVPQDMERIRQVQFAVMGVCLHTPWESKCLVQALTAKKLLNQMDLPCTLYMGVRKGEDGNMLAHAWLRCGNVFVTGGAGHMYYAVTGIYGDPVKTGD